MEGHIPPRFIDIQIVMETFFFESSQSPPNLMLPIRALYIIKFWTLTSGHPPRSVFRHS